MFCVITYFFLMVHASHAKNFEAYRVTVNLSATFFVKVKGQLSLKVSAQQETL